jgi:Na+-driven multidrug efflux pump
LLIAFSLILPVRLGVTGIFWAAPAADILAILITALVIFRVWKQLSEPKTQTATAAEICSQLSERIETMAE